MLEPFDLGSEEERAYLALLDAPSLTVGDLAGAEDDGAVTEALLRLETAGLVTRLPGTPGRYAAVEPAIGWAGTVAGREAAARDAAAAAEQSRALADQLAERYRRAGRSPVDLIEVVVGREAARQRMFQLERSVRGELRGIDMPPYLSGDNPIEVELMSKGVTSRWLYDRSGLELPGKLAEISRFRSRGEEARLIAGAPFKLVLADQSLAMIPFTDEPNGTTSALLIGPSALLDGLSRLFESLWRFAVPLQSPAPGPAGEGPAETVADLPSAEDSQLLALLATGMTDKTIARRLDLSQRTIQKRVQQLLRRLDSDTRFQAGVRARERGWL